MDYRKLLLNIVLAAPFAFLLFDSDPINPSGQWALIYLLLTTSVTVLQKQFKILAIKYRRTLGLWTAAMVVFHLTHYFIEGGVSKAIRDAFYDYQAIGWVSVILLSLMTLTSSKFAQKKLKQNWSKLHLSIYIVLGLGLVHGATATKLGWYTIYPFAIAAALIFLKKSYKAKALLGVGVLCAYTLIAIPNPPLSTAATNPISEWDECLISPPNHCEVKIEPVIEAKIVSMSCINGKHVEYHADGNVVILEQCLKDKTKYEIKTFDNFENTVVTPRIHNDI